MEDYMNDILDLLKLQKIVDANKEKSFVQRILNPQLRLDNQDGTYSTHSMSWGQAGDKFIVFPTVLKSQDGALKRYDPREAWKHTQQTGNFIIFDSGEDAEWFSQNYKKLWEK